jgi:SlyX protein
MHALGGAVSTEDRFIDIEIKLAHQEDLVESLNQLVYAQQKRMDQLEAMCAALARHIRDNAAPGQGPSLDNERPPHY